MNSRSKDLVEPVMSVVGWAKDYAGGALEASVYGSIAWAGVCLLLPVGETLLAFISFF